MTVVAVAAQDPIRLARRRAGWTVALLALFGWVLLITWDRSPYGRYLDHDALAESGLGSGPTVAVFVAGWVLMLAAMMFPSTYALVAVFSPVAERRGARRQLVTSLLGGYLVAWTAVGLAFVVLDIGIHALVERWGWLDSHPEVIAATALAGAGAFQFSEVKDRCLTKCRSPRTFVLTRWKGRRPLLEAAVLGAEHGRHCIGCCVALMLVAFAVGSGSLGWMLLLGAVMATEKLAPWGRRLTTPLGVVLFALAGLTLL